MLRFGTAITANKKIPSFFSSNDAKILALRFSTFADTATWLNKMDGGMTYLRNVVVNDSLGIGEQLEKEMQGLVNTYKCEWKEAVNDAEFRKRFNHFVNAPEEKDPSLQFVELRSQIKAKEW